MKKSLIITLSLIVLIALLATAAFFATRMLAQPSAEDTAAENSGHGGRQMMMVVEDTGGGGPVSLSIQVEPAPSLPNRPAETSGVLVRRADNSLIVGTGNIELSVDINGDTGEESVSLSSDGPEVEVVISRDTVLYQDVTDMDIDPSQATNGSITLQQEIDPADSLEDIGENIELEVWGEQRGDRIVAEVVVYREVSGF